jgi:pyruvate/2-oxoglutarate dehydrogenase complex dihydrolipoamide acyltransferase (E2) component
MHSWHKTIRPAKTVEEIKITGVRRKIAERLQTASQSIAHITPTLKKSAELKVATTSERHRSGLSAQIDDVSLSNAVDCPIGD